MERQTQHLNSYRILPWNFSGSIKRLSINKIKKKSIVINLIHKENHLKHKQEVQGPHRSPESYRLIFRLWTHATLLFFIAIRSQCQ
jgi:hypothetical protein